MSDDPLSNHYPHSPPPPPPCCPQLLELQEAAEGVSLWEAQVARHPSGKDLVNAISSLHRARFRLVWLQQQGLAGQHRSAVTVLGFTSRRFKQKHPGYPGDEALA